MYKKARLHFKKADPRLYKASLEFEIADLKLSDDLFRDIVWTIVGQQLSGKAADTIFERFQKLLPGGRVVPEEILELSDEEMRSAGLSGAKARAIRDLSEKTASGELDLPALASLSDLEVAAQLVKVKGIGPWTAEMILMFSLGRTDVFSLGDLVLRKEIMNLHGWKKLPGEKRLQSALARWSPYRTYAARILWKIADSRKKRAAPPKRAKSRKKARKA
ncbi:MAG: DNA-3-methyladenine glycosylase 2 family protein [Candidatus Taylorbacteria bacterium]|nr:DNA-3-methyladenine glycosylase 2 family protein [Candidatus Taylorbacteria bacterium]